MFNLLIKADFFQKKVDIATLISYNILRSGRSSVWLERYLGVVEVARSSRVAPTS